MGWIPDGLHGVTVCCAGFEHMTFFGCFLVLFKIYKYIVGNAEGMACCLHCFLFGNVIASIAV